MSQVTVVARLISRVGLEDRARSELLKMVEETRKEPGCINYDLHRGLEDSKEFVFYENWESKEALDRHMQTPHFLRLSDLCDELFSEEPVIELFEMINPPKTVPV